MSVVLQFTLKLPYKEESAISHLQPGVEYCVTVRVTAFFNSNYAPSKPHCAFTSPPPANTSGKICAVQIRDADVSADQASSREVRLAANRSGVQMPTADVDHISVGLRASNWIRTQALC